MEELLKVGVISSTHGVRGEVKVFPTTDDPGRFKRLKRVILETENEKKLLEIEGVKFFKQFAILKFTGLDSINDVERYKGKALYVTRDNAVRLRENEYFIADLIGIQVFTEDGSLFGILADVLKTGANDVYEVGLQDGKTVLIPAIRECILSVDVAEKKMVVHLMEGLLD